MIRQKRGWIRIVESVFAILILAGFLTFMIASRSNKTEFGEYMADIENSILHDISLNDSLRQDILLNNTSSVNNYIQNRIPSNLNFSSRVCGISDACGCLNCPFEIDIYADSAFISSSLSCYAPKQFKLFIWRK